MKLFRFIKTVIIKTYNIIKNNIINLFNNTESVVILTFSAIGLASVLNELPFHYALPSFIDTPLVIPVIAVLSIYLITQVIKLRMNYNLYI